MGGYFFIKLFKKILIAVLKTPPYIVILSEVYGKSILKDYKLNPQSQVYSGVAGLWSF
ncbi:hypothetical protein [Butyrivibrio sp. VCD2006]|uniref:hypothetical protein n=1 Tax=Butyrivibrio sp. VCD2006 TaxID=1280664 RepID=UPI0012DF94EA|nr:hypothetical protein [Butyrivibrio sp. VCD2006]